MCSLNSKNDSVVMARPFGIPLLMREQVRACIF